MAEWLKELIALAEVQDSVPSTHLHNGSQPTVTSVPEDTIPSSDQSGHCTHGSTYTQTYII